MNQQEFEKLSSSLRTLVTTIPLNWGHIQNNRVDDKINMFSIESYDDLEDAISRLSDEDKNYLRRRWFLWKCAECDEYLFYRNDNVDKNPDHFDKEYDIIINNHLKFDVKGTVIPKNMRDDVESVISHPQEMINFFYQKQSTGRRYDIQNRLFIVHHSFVLPERELYLRCAWRSKGEIYRTFVENAEKINFAQYKGCKAAVLFILERKLNEVTYRIDGL